jgi:hypothetical protein
VSSSGWRSLARLRPAIRSCSRTSRRASWTSDDELGEPVDRDGARGRLLDRVVALRAFGVLGPTEALAEMGAFFAVFLAAGWRPGDSFEASGVVAAAAGAALLAAPPSSPRTPPTRRSPCERRRHAPLRRDRQPKRVGELRGQAAVTEGRDGQPSRKESRVPAGSTTGGRARSWEADLVRGSPGPR